MVEKVQITCIACSVFRPELEYLKKKRLVLLPVRYLDSELHVDPRRLCDHMVTAIADELARERRVLLLFGDCHAHMLDEASRPGVTRVEGTNCCEIMLGYERYRSLRGQNVFFLFPEWAVRWREILSTIGTFDEKSTAELMRESHSKFIYLDTGVRPVPVDQLKACSAHFCLPWEVLVTPLGPLARAIEDALEKMGTEELAR